jgi:hypothetical protein
MRHDPIALLVYALVAIVFVVLILKVLAHV